jgi:hypothetical protein
MAYPELHIRVTLDLPTLTHKWLTLDSRFFRRVLLPSHTSYFELELESFCSFSTYSCLWHLSPLFLNGALSPVEGKGSKILHRRHIQVTLNSRGVCAPPSAFHPFRDEGRLAPWIAVTWRYSDPTPAVIHCKNPPISKPVLTPSTHCLLTLKVTDGVLSVRDAIDLVNIYTITYYPW